MLAALNDLQVKAGDVLNAYITAPCKEKVWTVLEPEFGHDAGKYAIIVPALYGLKSAGAAFCAHLTSDDPTSTRIHTLRKYVGQAKAVELAPVRAKQIE